ncbi:3',5'-cyclic adenosine monophosphate phosphodiesterase CpdA [Thermoflexales bacterium]|nr:3',5'-cyclic adenosine monophosphate phosphodiesterase CpdA [Thermoflexales bacterium]
MNFSFIHITDHHLTESETALLDGFSPNYAFRKVMRHLAAQIGNQADFIISTGDVVEQSSPAAYEAFKQLLNVQATSAPAPGPLLISLEGLHQFPLYLLPGNHDDRSHFYQCLFPKGPMLPLMNAAFIHKGIQFICLDWGPHSKAVVHQETLNFLARSLETDLPAILLMHHQLVPMGSRWLDSFLADNLDQFWQIVSGRQVLGILCGHVHTTYERVIAGIPIFGLRSTAFPFVLQDEPLACLLPPHYRLITIQNSILTTQIFEVPL